MTVCRSSPVRWFLLLAVLALAGCSPAGSPAERTGAALGRETAPIVPTWTGLPENTATPTPTSTSTLAPTPAFSAAAVAAGRRHTCVVTDRRSVMCWGENEDGQLGDGTTILKNAPVDVLGLGGAVDAVSAGYNHTCTVTSGGRIQCWGNNAFGQLGDGTQTSRNTAMEVSLPGLAAAVSAGNYHTCGATEHSVYCWGIVDYQLLEGEDVFYITPKPYPIDVSNIPYDERILALDSGFDFDCLLTDAGSVYCWGRNDQGQLGQNEISYSINVPVRIGSLKGPAEKLTVGGSHACVILRGGAVQCWGYNNAGQLGVQFPRETAAPISVAGLSSAVEISAGAYHTCAVIAGGRVKCWGDKRFGQLGGAASASGGDLVDVAGLPGGARAVAAGGSHSCALMENGGIVCWGNDKYGQLGEGLPAPAATQTATPIPTQSGGEATAPPTKTRTPTPEITNRAVSVAAGRSHTCAVTVSGGVKCWGKNEHGELGNGTWADSSVPVEVTGLSSGVKSVAAGWGHTCALTASGGVKCWGYNKNGELGDGANETLNRPADVRGLQSGVTFLEAADDHTCAVLADGTVKCWGFNDYGQLGDGTSEDRNVPVKVEGLYGTIVGVAAGWGHTCALSSSGGVKCWGNNHYGQLGVQAGKENIHTPVTVSGMAYGATAISADGGQTCVITDKGAVMCWGNNKYGQLGDGTAEIRMLPVTVAGLTFAPAAVISGWNHSCALRENGDMACWGWNYYGQLGNGFRTTSTRPVNSGALMYGVREAALGWAHTCIVTEFGGVQCWGLNEFGQLGDGTTEDTYRPVDVIGLAG
jgi:alpha-tubulin suppressor-like RCC1 family protein